MNYPQFRKNHLAQQLRANGVFAPQLLELMTELPREQFVPPKFRDCAYADSPLELPHQQMMLSPAEQGAIVQALAIQANETVLEIGTGSGYLTALLAQLGQHVDSLEIFADLSEQAQQTLNELQIGNATLLANDANQGWPQQNGYDVICSTAGLPFYPENYRQNLTIGGRLFVIMGTVAPMQAIVITRTGDTSWDETTLFETMVPEMLNAPSTTAFTL